MKIIVTDRDSIQRGIVVRSSYAVISICDPDSPPAHIPKVSAVRGILYLAFHDTEPTAKFQPPPKI